ncbi:hypothetical protein UCDDA912_g02764 [Diaporthe ampelina]|uniref:Uncharacterized protein n=1 Tax=Diaporthe ampelina TaxID=1214573 RepID=A0A0G2HQQ5_9PEZI|nr:hypothetical protein UCDDA912_g02764 [Diaporthe ampelina]
MQAEQGSIHGRAACKQKNDVYLDRLEFIQVQDQANGRGGGGEGVDEFEVERVGLERPRGDGYAEPLQVESDPDPDAVTAGPGWMAIYQVVEGHTSMPEQHHSSASSEPMAPRLNCQPRLHLVQCDAEAGFSSHV